jgi:hypothetical protein
MEARGMMRWSLVAGVRLKACVFIGLAVHALIYILLIFKFDLYRGACGGGSQFPVCNLKGLKIANFARLYYPHFTTFRNETLEYY